jgi:hypothetical protein
LIQLLLRVRGANRRNRSLVHIPRVQVVKSSSFIVRGGVNRIRVVAFFTIIIVFAV